MKHCRNLLIEPKCCWDIRLSDIGDGKMLYANRPMGKLLGEKNCLPQEEKCIDSVCCIANYLIQECSFGYCFTELQFRITSHKHEGNENRDKWKRIFKINTFCVYSHMMRSRLDRFFLHGFSRRRQTQIFSRMLTWTTLLPSKIHRNPHSSWSSIFYAVFTNFPYEAPSKVIFCSRKHSLDRSISPKERIQFWCDCMLRTRSVLP